MLCSRNGYKYVKKKNYETGKQINSISQMMWGESKCAQTEFAVQVRIEGYYLGSLAQILRSDTEYPDDAGVQ